MSIENATHRDRQFYERCILYFWLSVAYRFYCCQQNLETSLMCKNDKQQKNVRQFVRLFSIYRCICVRVLYVLCCPFPHTKSSCQFIDLRRDCSDRSFFLLEKIFYLFFRIVRKYHLLIHDSFTLFW